MRRIVLAASAALLVLVPGEAGAGKPAPVTLRVEVLYEKPRIARDSWRRDLQDELLREIADAGCAEAVTDGDDPPADLWLSVTVREFTIEQGDGGTPQLDESTGRNRPGRSYLTRIALGYAIVEGPDADPIHADDFTVAQREETRSNPLWDPEYQSYKRAVGQTVRELRRHTCKRLPKIAALLENRPEASR